MTMKISIFQDANSTLPDTRDTSWDELKELFTKHPNINIVTNQPVTEKLKVPMFSPTEFRDGFTRSNATAIQIHFGVLDFDDISADQFEFIKKKLALTEYVCYTSWSHTKEKEIAGSYRVRFVFPFNRPVAAEEWNKDVRPKLHLFFNNIADPCKDLQRCYFMPIALNPNDHWSIKNVGLVFDVDALVTKTINELKADNQINKQDLIALRDKLKKAKNEHKQEMAEILTKGLNGEELADNGNRDNTYFKISALLAEEFPLQNPKHLTTFFHASLLDATKKGCDKSTPILLEKKIERAIQTVEIKQEQKKQEKLNEISSRISVAFSGKRTTAYTNEELLKFAADANTSLEGFTNHWIINSGTSYYIFFDGSYRPACSERSLISHCHKYLSPAITAGVDIIKKDDKESIIFKAVNELLAEYGQPADTIISDMTIEKSYFHHETKTLYEAVCPLRVTEAEYSHDVDTFINNLGGSQASVLKDFISVVTLLEKPCAALYLHSPPGYGKGTFMEGLARLWTTGSYTSLTSAMKDFNAKLASCPLVVADETMPRAFKEDGTTGELREFIQAKSRELKRKFQETATLNGAIRLIIAANNADMLDNQENLSKHDIDAIAERICYIDCENIESRRFLESLNQERFDALIKGDAIAKHALWLRDNHKIDYKARFLIRNEDSTYHKNMMVATGLPAYIANWLVSYLQQPNLLDATLSGLVRVYEGQLLVNTKALSDNWAVYTTNTRPPSSARLGKALNRLTIGQKTIPWGDKIISYWIIDTDSLIAWSTTNNYSTKEEILEALSTDTKELKGSISNTLSNVLALKKAGVVV